MLYSAVIVIFLATFCTATTIKECPGKPMPFEVRVEGCDTPPCNVIKGKNIIFEVDFGTERTIQHLTANVMAILGSVRIPYPLPSEQKDVCKNLLYDASCPLEPGEGVTYRFEMPVSKAYPEIPVEVELSMIDETENIVVCFSADIQVRSG